MPAIFIHIFKALVINLGFTMFTTSVLAIEITVSVMGIQLMKQEGQWTTN